MNKPAVEIQREYYPMTFYPESLNTIRQQLKNSSTDAETVFFQEAVSIPINQIHYYNEIKLKQFLFGQLTIIGATASIFSILFINPVITLFLLTLDILFILGFFSLEKYKSNLRLDFISISKKILNRDYRINYRKILNSVFSPTNLLLDSLNQREKIYDFKINESANKGLSEAYFLSYLSKWYIYPWRILEHCQFEENNYTPTADFILIYDDLKLSIDLEIDEPYTLKESLPIHLVEDEKYIYRDKFFLNLGYIVIRFAEYQIALYPDHCCLHIARTVNQFLDRDLKITIPDSTNITPLKPEEWKVKTWTQRESKIMADNKIRDTYLQPVKAFNARGVSDR